MTFIEHMPLRKIQRCSRTLTKHHQYVYVYGKSKNRDREKQLLS